MLSCPEGCVSEASVEPPGIDGDEPVFLRLKRVHRVLMDCRNPICCQSRSDPLAAVVTGAGSCSGIHAVLKTPRCVGAGRGRDEIDAQTEKSSSVFVGNTSLSLSFCP